MCKIKFYHKINYYKNNEIVKSIVEKKTLYYCLNCNYHCVNLPRYMQKHNRTQKHLSSVKLNILRLDITDDEIIRFYINDGDQYSFDNINWNDII